jgi:hypothetical protein
VLAVILHHADGASLPTALRAGGRAALTVAGLFLAVAAAWLGL